MPLIGSPVRAQGNGAPPFDQAPLLAKVTRPLRGPAANGIVTWSSDIDPNWCWGDVPDAMAGYSRSAGRDPVSRFTDFRNRRAIA